MPLWVTPLLTFLVSAYPQLASFFNSASITAAQLATDDATEQDAHQKLLEAIKEAEAKAK